MSAVRIALVSASAARDLDDDLPPLEAALRDAGGAVVRTEWDDAAIDWTAYDIALLRSTWDYTQRLPEFLAWAARVSTQTKLLNPLDVIRWNTDKHYLHDLEKSGVSIVPSAFVEPGEDAPAAIATFLARHDGAEFVVKPAVGAGSRDAQRYGRDQSADAIVHAQRLLGAQRSVLLQPYLDRVDDYGETALLYYGGVFSHAIRKGPLLRKNEDATRALFAAEHISPREPSAAERTLAEKTLGAIPFDKPLLYARVDLIQNESGEPTVLELELTEPSMFFAHADGSAARYAAAILKAGA
jgi:glutathione synthase/RimK-type ligase-like ATP-grasp enzyme